MASAPGLGSRWWPTAEKRLPEWKRIHVSNVARLSEAMVFTTGRGREGQIGSREDPPLA